MPMRVHLRSVERQTNQRNKHFSIILENIKNGKRNTRVLSIYNSDQNAWYGFNCVSSETRF